MNVNIRKTAIKDLRKISAPEKQRIHTAILNLENYPDVAQCKKLTNFEPAYRIRVGNYRILFDLYDNRIEIGRILHRKESYKK